MADNLTKLMEERGQAQNELTEAHEKLKNSMGELESRNREAGTLSEMADLLQSCFTLEEALGRNRLFSAEAVSRILRCLVGVQRLTKCPGSNNNLGSEFSCRAGL